VKTETGAVYSGVARVSGALLFLPADALQAAGGLDLLLELVAVIQFVVRVLPAAVRTDWLMDSGRRYLAVSALFVLLAGEWVGLDLLPSPSLFSRAWPRLCAGYAADALAVAPGRAPQTTPAEVLSRLAAAPAAPAPAVGLGEEWRLGGPVAGAALVADGVVAHLMAFPAVMH
jgi:hypothetical protein